MQPAENARSYCGTSAERRRHERLFSRHEFSHEKCSEIFPEIIEPFFCASKKCLPKISREIPLPKIKKKITDELLEERSKRARSGIALSNRWLRFSQGRGVP